ncbi:MAG: HD domain-containing protein [Thalassovita sp.]
MHTLRHALRQIAQRDMAQDAAHDLPHLDRVWENCRIIAADMGGTSRPLLAAAYLHDLVNLPKNAPNRAQASALSAQAAVSHLQALGFPENEIAETTHAIAAHSFSAGIEPETDTARILRDADRLDALGAIGIARAFAVSGALNRPLYDADDPFARTRDANDTQFALDHWPLKLLRLPDDMQTETGRRIAQQRLATMHRFLTDLAAEIGTQAPTHWI